VGVGPPRPGTRGLGARLRFWLAYAAYLAGFCLLLVYAVFAMNRGRYRATQRPPTERLVPAPHMSPGTARRLGFVGPARKGTFHGAAAVKAPGTIRIGCFGDSFTYGDEVAEGLDFPSFLGALARRSGRSDVEVLNFGTSWYGFHQAYLMWQEVGRPMGLDAVLIGPDCYRPERDTTFGHAGAASPYYLHARYVLDGDGVRLEEVEGETYRERFDAYYRFLPRWRYLRFDSNAPLVVAGLVGASRVLPNPFYYQYRHRSRNGEAAETYARLLRLGAAADPSTPVLLGQVNDAFRLPDRSNLAVRRLAPPETFPYLAVTSHFGPQGNELIARQYWALLRGESGADLPWIRFGDLPAESLAPLPLTLEGRLVAELNGRPVGELRDQDDRGNDAGRTSLSGAAALLILAPEGVDGAWVALGAAPREGSRVTVELETADGIRRVDLGAPRPVGGPSGVWRLPPGPLEVAPGGRIGLRTERDAGRARVMFQDVEILRGVAEPGRTERQLELRAATGRLKRLRALADGYVPLDGGAPRGILALRAGGRRAPVASWYLEHRRVELGAPPFRVLP